MKSVQRPATGKIINDDDDKSMQEWAWIMQVGPLLNKQGANAGLKL